MSLTSPKSIGRKTRERMQTLHEQSLLNLEQYTRQITVAGDIMYRALRNGFSIGPLHITWCKGISVAKSTWGYHTGAEGRMGFYKKAPKGK